MKKICKITAIIIILNFLCTTNALAITQSDINKQKDEQSQVNDKIDKVEEKQEEIENKKTEAQNQVEKLNKQIDEYENQIDALETEISGLETKIEDAGNKIKEEEDNYNELDKSLKERLIALYENGETTYLDVLLSSNSITDFISNFYIVSELANYDTEMLQKIEEKKQTIEKEKKELEENKQSLDNSKQAKTTKAQALTVTQKEKQNYVSQLSVEEQKLENELAELKNYESSISKKIKQMQAAYDKELEEARKREEERKKAAQKNGGTSSTTTNSNQSASSFGFGWPVANPVIGTAYGVSGRYWSSGRHTGLDFRASDNTPIFSIGDGQVFDTGYSSAYGNYVEIYHGNNVYSFYAHATRVQVSIGQKVTKGQQIMLSGHTGNVTGPHLHFEIRTPGYRYANCVNPRPYLP